MAEAEWLRPSAATHRNRSQGGPGGGVMDVAKTSAASVNRYNPAEGFGQAEGAEAGYRRARDLEGMRNAPTDKLTHQPNVVWWDN